MATRHESLVQAAPSPVLLIDTPGPARGTTAASITELRAAGLNAKAIRWPRFRWGKTTGSVTAHAFHRFERAIGPGSRPVVIGKGVGGDVAYRLLIRDGARAAVLVASDTMVEPSTGARGPLLLIDGAGAPAMNAEDLRAAGICDQHIVQSSRDELTRDGFDEDLAHYISDWLDFHQLTTLKENRP